MTSLIEAIDQQIGDLFAGWNIYSTLLTLAIVGYLTYVVVVTVEPDTHPMLLQRQSNPGYVRHSGESAVYRSADAPQGYPLRSGLNVKPPGAPAYSSGKDGDLRDIWRRVTGELPLEKAPGGSVSTAGEERGKIMTVFGKEEVTDHDISDLTKEIAIIGSCIKKQGATRIAIYLPNSVEFLVALFACSFYGLSPILIPYNQPQDSVLEQLATTKADGLIAQAGSVPLEEVCERYTALKQVIWVVEKTSQHMDWTDVPKQVGGKMDVSMWHQLVQDHQDVSISSIPDIKSEELPTIVTIWLSKLGSTGEVVEFTHKNFVAAIASLQFSLPLRQRLNPSDLFLAADVWTNTYALCWTLAALFSHASLAINSVAGPAVKLPLCLMGVAPTVVVASAESASDLHAENAPQVSGGLKKIAHNAQMSALDTGHMPTDNIFTNLNAPHRDAVGAAPGKLRLLLISERAGTENPPLSSEDLSDLRIFTNARIAYALTAAKVAGAIAQTNVFDYRRIGAKNKHSHFGGPLSSVEIKLIDTATHKTSDHDPKGQLVVSGPSVAGGDVILDITAKINDDFTLAYA